MADEPLIEDVLRQLEALIAAATPEPWEASIEEREPIGGSSFIRIGGFDDAIPDMYVYHETKSHLPQTWISLQRPGNTRRSGSRRFGDCAIRVPYRSDWPAG